MKEKAKSFFMFGYFLPAEMVLINFLRKLIKDESYWQFNIFTLPTKCKKLIKKLGFSRNDNAGQARNILKKFVDCKLISLAKDNGERQLYNINPMIKDLKVIGIDHKEVASIPDYLLNLIRQVQAIEFFQKLLSESYDQPAKLRDAVVSAIEQVMSGDYFQNRFVGDKVSAKTVLVNFADQRKSGWDILRFASASTASTKLGICWRGFEKFEFAVSQVLSEQLQADELGASKQHYLLAQMYETAEEKLKQKERELQDRKVNLLEMKKISAEKLEQIQQQLKHLTEQIAENKKLLSTWEEDLQNTMQEQRQLENKR